MPHAAVRADYLQLFHDPANPAAPAPDAGGWLGWKGGGGGPLQLDLSGGAATVRSPWGVDINHAPPGAGYLHLLYVLFTRQTVRPDLGGGNRFVQQGHSLDLTGVAMEFEMRGALDARDSRLVLLVQADVPRENPTVRANFILSGQSLAVTPDWSVQRLHLDPNPGLWTCLGTRGPGADHPTYGDAPIADVLRDVNVDLILVLFPLDIAPDPATAPIPGGPAAWHALRAGRDYPIDQQRLPQGEVSIRSIRFRYPA